MECSSQTQVVVRPKSKIHLIGESFQPIETLSLSLRLEPTGLNKMFSCHLPITFSWVPEVSAHPMHYPKSQVDFI